MISSIFNDTTPKKATVDLSMETLHCFAELEWGEVSLVSHVGHFVVKSALQHVVKKYDINRPYT